MREARSSFPAARGTLPGAGLPQPSREGGSPRASVPPQDGQVFGALPIPEEHRAFAPPDARSGQGLPQPTGQARRTRRERVEATAATLASQVPGTPEESRHSVDLSSSAPDGEPPKRQRVTLRGGEPAPAKQQEVRVYAAPVLDGLGKFDLGSVPASVTPPKTWRKAAWFATGASGAVVVGLLFAGTFLVGGPATSSNALDGGWPGRQNGGNPDLSALVPETKPQGGPAGATQDHHTSGTTPEDTPADQARNTTGTESSTGPTGESSSSGPATDGSASSPTTTGSPSSSEPPQKPPVTAAARETKPSVYYAKHDTKTMGDNSETFFNTVTTDPGAASSVTSGDLEQQGPQGLRKRYSDVAYFEVKKVTIDPDHNTTVNTVEVTHEDGSKSTEQQTLTFDDDGKITDDGR
ncbi:hypothetical protein [Amycolatopsis ultiminotia]|uniref:hypothetical protein n=1 Tax=Amycolatopsis ultiminotia TaxID=543629 RepID=UPI0031F13723